MKLTQLNALALADAHDWFSHCCASTRWCELMVAGRPYHSTEQLLDMAKVNWAKCSKADFLQAFEAHPMIGDVASLRAKYAATKQLASNEQQGAAQADEATLAALADKNHQYLAKHGFIFIICATGLSAQTMLDALSARLPNDTAKEITNAAVEQLKITLLRIQKGLKLL